MKNSTTVISIQFLLASVALVLAIQTVERLADLDNCHRIQWVCVSFLWMEVFACIVIFFLLYSGIQKTSLGKGPKLSAVFAMTFGLICLFAKIYEASDLLYSGGYLNQQKDTDILDALYFSIVTTTTLGYGDFQPDGPFRLFAALQSILGLVVFGLLLDIITADRK